MNKIMERFHFEGVLQILEEKYGKKFMLDKYGFILSVV